MGMRQYTIEVSEAVYNSLSQQASKQNATLQDILEYLLTVAPLVLPETAKTKDEQALQLELIKLYATNLGYDDLRSLKQFLADFFSQRAIKKADKIWDEHNLSDETMELWLNGG